MRAGKTIEQMENQRDFPAQSPHTSIPRWIPALPVQYGHPLEGRPHVNVIDEVRLTRKQLGEERTRAWGDNMNMWVTIKNPQKSGRKGGCPAA